VASASPLHLKTSTHTTFLRQEREAERRVVAGMGDRQLVADRDADERDPTRAARRSGASGWSRVFRVAFGNEARVGAL
jgi:hypothetical protein